MNVPRTDPRPTVAADKAAHLQLTAALAAQLDGIAAEVSPAPLRVRVVDSGVAHLHHLARRTEPTVMVLAEGDVDAVAPDAVLLTLDEGVTATERSAALERARDLLHPGGRLVLAAYVVTRPGGPDNPRLSTLIEELWHAFGTMLHIDDVRSFRRGSEPQSRMAILTLTSLWPRLQ